MFIVFYFRFIKDIYNIIFIIDLTLILLVNLDIVYF